MTLGYSATRKSRARSATSVSRSTTRLPLPSKLTSDRPGQSGLALPVCHTAKEGSALSSFLAADVPEMVW